MLPVAHHVNAAVIRGMRLGGKHLCCRVVVVETQTSGLVLVDTGLGTTDYADISSRLGIEFARGYARPLVDPSLAVHNQLVTAGYSPDDVRHIVLTHLDLDHVGGLADFPQARVHVHQAELEAATTRRGPRAKSRYRPPMWAHGPKWETYRERGETWNGFGAVHDLRGIPSEIVMVPLPGHTHGHCGIAVQSADGWLLHAGDAFFDRREVHGAARVCAPQVRAFEFAVTTSLRQRDHNQDRLRELTCSHPEIDVFCAHDPTRLPERLGLPSRC